MAQEDRAVSVEHWRTAWSVYGGDPDVLKECLGSVESSWESGLLGNQICRGFLDDRPSPLPDSVT